MVFSLKKLSYARAYIHTLVREKATDLSRIPFLVIYSCHPLFRLRLIEIINFRFIHSLTWWFFSQAYAFARQQWLRESNVGALMRHLSIWADRSIKTRLAIKPNDFLHKQKKIRPMLYVSVYLCILVAYCHLNTALSLCIRVFLCETTTISCYFVGADFFIWFGTLISHSYVCFHGLFGWHS